MSRLDAVRRRMVDLGVDVTLLSVGPDLPWLIGYEAMPLERLTMLVVPTDDGAARWSCPPSRHPGSSNTPA